MMIRRATPQDADSVIALSAKIPHLDFLSEVFDRWQADLRGGLFLALEEDELLGFCGLTFPAPGQAWLQGMRIDPSTQKKGVGRSLTQYLDQLAQDSGAQVIRAITAPSNTGAQRLLESMGFESNQRWAVYFHLPLVKIGPSLGISRTPMVSITDLPLSFYPTYAFASLTPDWWVDARDHEEIYESKEGWARAWWDEIPSLGRLEAGSEGLDWFIVQAKRRGAQMVNLALRLEQEDLLIHDLNPDERDQIREEWLVYEKAL